MKITKRDVLIGLVLAGIYCYLAFRDPFVIPKEFSKPIRSTRVMLDTTHKERQEYLITDAKLLEEAITKPLQAATLDRSRAKWMHLGGLEISFEDGSEIGFWMFLPWGQVKYGQTYYTVDFTLLRKHIEKDFRGSPYQRTMLFSK